VTRPKGELISQKSGRCSTFLSQPHRQPLLFDAKISLDRQKQPPYTLTPRKQCLIQKGTRRISREIPGSAAFAMHCKGLELGGYECRGFYGQALQLVLNPKGGNHHGIGLPARMEEDGTNRQMKRKGNLLKKDRLGRIWDLQTGMPEESLLRDLGIEP